MSADHDAVRPGILARFDQAHTEIGVQLDKLITLHASASKDGFAIKEIVIAGLFEWIHAEYGHEHCAGLLAVAIDRLATPGGTR